MFSGSYVSLLSVTKYIGGTTDIRVRYGSERVRFSLIPESTVGRRFFGKPTPKRRGSLTVVLEDESDDIGDGGSNDPACLRGDNVRRNVRRVRVVGPAVSRAAYRRVTRKPTQ